MIEIVDTTTRDGNQSLWGATGADHAGRRWRSRRRWTASASARCDFTSTTHMAVSVRFHREDPWERLRMVSAAMPNTPLST